MRNFTILYKNTRVSRHPEATVFDVNINPSYSGSHTDETFMRCRIKDFYRNADVLSSGMTFEQSEVMLILIFSAAFHNPRNILDGFRDFCRTFLHVLGKCNPAIFACKILRQNRGLGKMRKFFVLVLLFPFLKKKKQKNFSHRTNILLQILSHLIT